MCDVTRQPWCGQALKSVEPGLIDWIAIHSLKAPTSLSNFAISSARVLLVLSCERRLVDFNRAPVLARHLHALRSFETQQFRSMTE